jgi:hypothetical protein
MPMAKICADIRPNALSQKDLVDIFFKFLYILQGICQKLDDDGGVPLTTYEANCITALINASVDNSTGGHINLAKAETSTLEPTAVVKPTGIGNPELISLMYQITNAFETLCEQLDADALTLSTYEANCYTAKFLHMVENLRGNTLGNSGGMGDGSAYYFRLGAMNQRELVDWLYNTVDAIETLTEQLDGDGTVTDTDYEAIWFTALMTLTVENSKDQRVGN